MRKTKEVNHEKCIEKVRDQIMKADPKVNYVRFDLSNIVTWDEKNKRSQYKKTGQRVVVGLINKNGNQKEEKSFVAHDYCPYCGKKYQ